MAELRLDLDVMERNAKRIASEVSALGKLWRPHVKAHCQPKIAKMLVELGACGVTCATVAEVEVMADAGIPSALLAHIAVDSGDLNRLSAASRKLDLLVCVDHYAQAERFSEAATQNGTKFDLLVDIDVGMGRTGTRPRVDALQIARAANELPGVSVAGIMGYEGHLLTIADQDEKTAAIFEAINMLQATKDAFVDANITCDVVSAGGSGSFWITGQHAAVTELQAGGGIFGDLFYQRACGLKDVESALTIRADVVSRPSLTTAVVNCGRKASNPATYSSEVISVAGATVQSMSAEHTVLSLSDDARDLRIGDRVTFAVGYSDHSILMHREIHVYRGEQFIETWPVIRPV